MLSYIFEISKRFRESKRQDHYISFVSSSSTTGIALGTGVLILLLSIMNGFEYELRNSLLKIVPHAELFSIDNKGLVVEQTFVEQVENDPRVEAVFTLNKATGLIQFGRDMKSVSLVGADSTYLNAKFVDTSYISILKPGDRNILLGAKIIERLNIEIGDEIQVLLPSTTQDLSFQAPQSAWFKVAGVLTIGGEIDNQIGLVDKQTLGELLQLQSRITHIEIQLKDAFESYSLIREYGYSFNQAAYMSDWTRTHGHLYQDIQLVKTLVYIVLTLVIGVASFNIVSSLVMSVKERRKEIAILKTIGSQNLDIALIFVYKGLYHGVKGALIGTVIGVLLALYLSQIIEIIEYISGIQILSGDIYFTSTIPSKLSWVDVVFTDVLVLVIAILSTIYPAKQAIKLSPVENLH